MLKFLPQKLNITKIMVNRCTCNSLINHNVIFHTFLNLYFLQKQPNSLEELICTMLKAWIHNFLSDGDMHSQVIVTEENYIAHFCSLILHILIKINALTNNDKIMKWYTEQHLPWWVCWNWSRLRPATDKHLPLYHSHSTVVENILNSN